jgi:hypothetical protein
MIALFVIVVVVLIVVMCIAAKNQSNPSGPTHLPPPRSRPRSQRAQRPQPPMGYIVAQSNRRRHG